MYLKGRSKIFFLIVKVMIWVENPKEPCTNTTRINKDKNQHKTILFLHSRNSQLESELKS